MRRSFGISGSRPQWSGCLGALAVLVLFWGSSATPLLADSAAEGASPTLIEAGFITKFPLFVSWPEAAWVPGGEPLVIGVFGDDQILHDLRRLAPFVELEGSRLEVRPVEAAGEAQGCQIVFIGAVEDERLDQILEALRGRPVLTVADGAGFARRGVHIGFFREDERVGFELNQQACEESGLALDFRLRSVARLVE